MKLWKIDTTKIHCKAIESFNNHVTCPGEKKSSKDDKKYNNHVIMDKKRDLEHETLVLVSKI